MVDIRPSQLNPAITPLREDDIIIVDQGASGVNKSSVIETVNSVAPVATQSEAQAGTDNTKRMTSLRTKQSIASEVGVTLASNSQGSKADTAVQSVNGKSGNSVTIVKGDVGLGNVDNTSDINKPISTAQQSALDLKANSAVTISAGTGLTGGGTLAANRSIALSSSSIASLAKADSAVQTVNGIAPIAGNVTVPAKFVFGEVDITDYGYTIGSPTGFASAVNSAISYLVSIGGGIARVPTGVHTLDDTIVMQSKCYLVGNGSGSTTIKSKDSLNKNMITTKDSSSLLGGNTDGGEAYWGVIGMTLHGNKAQNTSGHSIYTYSRAYLLEDVRVFHSAGSSIKSEWYTGAVNWLQPGLTDTDKAMEAQIHNFHSHYSRLTGVDWNGPHDSQWSNIIVAQSGQDAPGTYDGIFVGPASGGLQATNVHSWGDYQRYAFNLNSGWLNFANCEADDAYTALINWQGDNITWMGGVQFGAVFSTPPTVRDLNLKGFILGSPSKAIVNPRIDCIVLNCPKGAVDFVNVAGFTGSIKVTGRLTNSDLIPGSIGYDFSSPVPNAGLEINININNVSDRNTLSRSAMRVALPENGSDAFPNISLNGNLGTGIKVTDTEIGFSISGSGKVSAFGPTWQLLPRSPNVGSIGTSWVEGLMYFDTTTKKVRVYNGTSWVDLH